MTEQVPPPAGELIDQRELMVAGRVGSIAVSRRGDGPPLIVLHPLALSGAVWTDLASRLASDFDVIAPDARGHGRSEWDGGAFSMLDLAEDITSVLDGFELKSAHILGMSMGGSAALMFAGLHPDRVDRLLLADTTAWYGRDASTAWSERAERAVAMPRQRQVPFQVDRWFTEDFRAARPDVVDFVADIFLKTDGLVHAQASRAMGTMDSRELLGRITAPTLVITGAEDYATPPEMGQFIADNVANGRASTLPGLRHLSLIECPELASILSEHLSGRGMTA